MSLIQGLQEQVQFQGRMNPLAFGQVPFGLPADSSLHDPTCGFGMSGGASSEGSGNVFSKSEKWVGTPPVPNFKAWVSRETEVIGWSQFIADLMGLYDFSKVCSCDALAGDSQKRFPRTPAIQQSD